MGFEKTGKLLERGTIELAPLAYMRGRTLNHAFIILDEAQNTTPEQMKMFLTRIGFGAKAVVNGDVTQIDLARGQKSGLIEARASSPACAASPSRSSARRTWCATRWWRASSMPTTRGRKSRVFIQYAVPRRGVPRRVCASGRAASLPGHCEIVGERPRPASQPRVQAERSRHQRAQLSP